jgi:DNA-binding LacI/PurR family transcriptional regulator
MTTLLDVARHAGVSPATVSRVLNNHETVNRESRERVTASIASLAYTPNPMARGLRRGKSDTVALVVGDIAQTHFAELTMQVQCALEPKGIDLMLVNLGHRVDRLAALFGRAASMRLRGVVVALSDKLSSSVKPELALLSRGGLRVVSVGQDLSGQGIPSIVHDERAAARQSVDYLLSNGHRRIAYVGRIRGSAIGAERCRGYRDALMAAGRFDPALVWDEAFRYGAGERAVHKAIDTGLRFTAIQAASDEIAIGAIAALKDRGRAVPEDVAVVGFGGLTMGAYTRPALTTISSHPEQAAMHVALLIDDRRGTRGAALVRLSRELIVRGSA